MLGLPKTVMFPTIISTETKSLRLSIVSGGKGNLRRVAAVIFFVGLYIHPDGFHAMRGRLTAVAAAEEAMTARGFSLAMSVTWMRASSWDFEARVRRARQTSQPPSAAA